MTRIAYYLPSVISKLSEHHPFPGLSRYAEVFRLYGHWAVPVDRTLTIKTPIRDVSHFPVPEFRPLSKTYEELCNERAVEVLKDAEALGRTMYVLYSGGIDSTCLVVSLLKHASKAQKDNMVILLSHESIMENPNFYADHIKGKLRTESSISYPNLIGEDVYILSAEHNDMVLGTEKLGKLIMLFGTESPHKKYDRDTLTTLYATHINGDRDTASFYMDIFERIGHASPVPLDTNADFLWWVNFAIKWQACYYYMLLFTPRTNVANVTREYLDSRFISFYNTEEFQLWSMNNPDKKIKDSWKSYKWVCKDVIYDYTKDADYRDNKTKKGSLLPLLGLNPPNHVIDESLNFFTELSPETYLQHDNDFAS